MRPIKCFLINLFRATLPTPHMHRRQRTREAAEDSTRTSIARLKIEGERKRKDDKRRERAQKLGELYLVPSF